MQREEKSERSRRQVLDAALELFAHQGYRATSVREIAVGANVSTGNVYHHFPDKEAIFKTLLDEFWKISETPRYPFTRALRSGRFPDNIELLGAAARDSVREFRSYMALFFVDVLEFEGTHIKRFYSQAPARFTELLEKSGGDELLHRLRPGVSPATALLMTWRLFFNYFTIEVLFNVAEPFGKDSVTVIGEIADIIRNGILKG
jgi:AcrR family transcriptional regulator